MRVSEEMSDRAILGEIAARVARCRLNRNMTQEALAEQAGVSRPTVQRLENGASIQLTNLIRILRVLGLITNLEGLVPPPVPSPIQQVRMAGRQRQRASGRRAVEDQPPAAWRWENGE